MKISAMQLASRLDLKVRDYNRHGRTDEKLVTLKAPGRGEDDKEKLMRFTKATGLKVVFQGEDRKRYLLGGCHYMAVYKRKEFDRVKVDEDAGLPKQEKVVTPPPPAQKQALKQPNDYDEALDLLRRAGSALRQNYTGGANANLAMEISEFLDE